MLTVLVSITLTTAVDRGLLGGTAGPRGPQGPAGPAAAQSDSQLPTEPVFDALEGDPQRFADILAKDVDAREEKLTQQIERLRTDLVALCETLAGTAALVSEGITCPE